jgi:ubiquinone/menaquinone biosynthesis C-methylase UbiE
MDQEEALKGQEEARVEQEEARVEQEQEGLAWQTRLWDRMSDVYQREIDKRFAPVVEGCIGRAALQLGESVLDLGAGTGSVTLQAASRVGPSGAVVAVDLSPEMLERTRRRADAEGFSNVNVLEGRAEEVPAPDGGFDVLIASLSLMFAVDKPRAAAECARVLRPGGRFVAAAWGGVEDTDLVRFQQLAGSFAPPPPVPGVGPGALADPTDFLGQLAAAGITARVESDVVTFGFDNFEQAWDVFAGVTTAKLDPARRERAQRAVRDEMWLEPSSGRIFKNRLLYIVGERS